MFSFCLGEDLVDAPAVCTQTLPIRQRQYWHGGLTRHNIWHLRHGTSFGTECNGNSKALSEETYQYPAGLASSLLNLRIKMDRVRLAGLVTAGKKPVSLPSQDKVSQLACQSLMRHYSSLIMAIQIKHSVLFLLILLHSLIRRWNLQDLGRRITQAWTWTSHGVKIGWARVATCLESATIVLYSFIHDELFLGFSRKFCDSWFCKAPYPFLSSVNGMP